MTDATILIPTFRHAALVPYSVRSALDQRGASVEVFVVGDGVEDDTRDALRPFADDDRVRFFDFPKGERHGELNRHEALHEAQGEIVCYLSDDDLLLPDHVSAMQGLLTGADLAHSPHFWIDVHGALNFLPRNLGRAAYVELARSGTESIGLSGAAHTLESYRRLPHGWRTTPATEHTDHHMWLQWLGLPGFRGAVGSRPTFLWFPDVVWGAIEIGERAATLANWLRRSREPGFEEELDRMTRNSILRAAEDEHLRAQTEKRVLDTVLATRTWQLRQRLVSVSLLRVLLARRRGAR